MDRAGLDAQPTEKSFQSKNRAILAAFYVNVIYFSSSLKKFRKNLGEVLGTSHLLCQIHINTQNTQFYLNHFLLFEVWWPTLLYAKQALNIACLLQYSL